MRKVHAALLAILLLFFVSGYGSTARQSSNSADINDGSLSSEEKLEDFEYMYNVLKENYAFFEVNKRLSGIDTSTPSSDKLVKEHIISNNIKTKVLLDSKIAYLGISSFSGFNIENDMKIIRPFLEAVSKYPVLIIYIRGNGGGDSRYWSDNLVPMLINKPLRNTNYLVFRGGTFGEAFFKGGYETFKKI